MPYTYEKRWAGLGALCLAMSVITLDNTVLDVALPSISTDLQASMSELQWIVDIYILVFASILITIGALGDHFGRKRFLKIGIALFSLASLGGGTFNLNHRADFLPQSEWFWRSIHYAFHALHHYPYVYRL